ncbi:DUF6882 domain-containing protein [Undibacterium sp. Ji83W]|uniref:DUF6882 domain-containing protein n=1 Tax=Undibacterium sp. Ji83W TaxID=3413043 RepID=UPI003BEFAFAF
MMGQGRYSGTAASPLRGVSILSLVIFALTLLTTTAQARQQGWEQILVASAEYSVTTQKALDDDYQISSYEQWDLDQGTGDLTFSDNGVLKLSAKIQFVGSYSERSKTWLWSWGNSTISPALFKRMDVLKSLGAKHHFNKLTERTWPAQLADGWEMATVANYLLKTKGIYRVPFETGFVFLLITDIRKVPPE